MNFNNNMKQVLHILLTLLLLFTFSCNDDNVNNDNNSILIGSWGEQFPADEFFELTFYNDDTYVIGRRSTNTIEGYWSHLKKMISGTHFWVSRKHLQRYVDCESFRYNTKHLSESERFDVFLQNTKRRLRYSQIN